MTYHRHNIERLTAYVPGEQPQDGRIIKLNTNENPYPPSAAVLSAIRAVSAEMLRRYPPPAAEPFRRLAAQVHNVSPQMVIAANGGDELLRLAVTVFCQDGRGGIAICEPTYSLYDTLAAIHDTPVTRVALNQDWSLPDDLADRALADGCRLVIVCSPHAPSGRLVMRQQLESLAENLRNQAVLLVDEAYVDFSEADALPLLAADSGLDNVLLLRTLSKGYSLAGLRFGYGLGNSDLIAALDKARDSYNTDVVAQTAAIAALEHRENAAKTWQTVKRDRDRLSQALVDRGYDVEPSATNFLLVHPPPAGSGAGQIYDSLKQQGILVRYFDQDRLRDSLRITVGTPTQNMALITALDRITENRKS